MSEPTQLKSVETDPFDLAAIRLSQNFISTAGVKKRLTTVPVRRKPNKQDFNRVHPSEDYRANLSIINFKEERDTYLVPRHLQEELLGETEPVTAYTAINRQGVVFLWLVRLPLEGDKPNAWWDSARAAAETAMTSWTRVQANMSLGAYEISLGDAIKVEPEWPDLTFQEIYKIAFRDRLITGLDHAAVQRLRGQI
jgi:hypothetical protein